jgi:hypothetical protein
MPTPKVPHHDQQREEQAKDDHLGDEHPLAAEIVRQATKQDGADQDAGEARGGDESDLGLGEVELAGDQRHRHAAHEDDKAFKELAGGGERPDKPLHPRHRGGLHRGAIRPCRQFVDVFLYRLRRRSGGLGARFRHGGVAHLHGPPHDGHLGRFLSLPYMGHGDPAVMTAPA